MTIKQLKKNDSYPWKLLLLADPSPTMVEKYLANSSVASFINEDNQTIGVIVWQKIADHQIEIMNLGVAEDSQGLGIGTKLLKYVIDLSKIDNTVFEMIVHTGSTSRQALALYQKMGFVLEERLKDYFIKHYTEQIYENGEQLKDQLKLVLKIK